MLIGLTGKKQSGKSTIANYLDKYHNFQEHSFAEPLKRILIELFCINPIYLYGTEQDKNTVIPELNITGRLLMQRFGTELLRDTLPTIIPRVGSVWIRRMDIELRRETNSCVVISDVRFPDEVDFIRSKGGLIIKIERGNEVNNDIHPSENQNIINADIIIQNNSDLDTLYRKIDDILRNYSTSE